MPFSARGEPLQQVFVTESQLIDRFVGNQLWMWGQNCRGALGINVAGNTARSSPVQTISGGTNWVSMDAGDLTTAAIKSDGTLWSWGFGTNGALGNNSVTSDVSSPVQTISGGTNWRQVSITESHTLATKTDGTLWTWGFGLNGELGNSSATSQSSPIQTISGGTNWRQASTGANFSAATKTDGTLWLWGSNSYGRLGINSTASQSSPVQTISGGTNWRIVSLGRGHSTAIKTDGTLWLWGFNSFGQLGDGSSSFRSSPVQTISGGTNWKQSTGGRYHTAAIKIDGSLWLWGGQQAGSLGNNGTGFTGVSSPVQTVSGGNNWKQVEVGSCFSAAIKTDGSLWVWGLNTNGLLGNNNTTSSSSPVQTVSGGTNWKQVAAGSLQIGAINHTNN